MLTQSADEQFSLSEDLDAAVRTGDQARVEQVLAAVTLERRVALAATLIATFVEWRDTPQRRYPDLRSFRWLRMVAVRVDAVHAQLAAAASRHRVGAA